MNQTFFSNLEINDMKRKNIMKSKLEFAALFSPFQLRGTVTDWDRTLFLLIEIGFHDFI